MTEDELLQYLRDLERQHNGRAGEPRVIDPEVELFKVMPKGEKVVTGTQPNPTPTYEYRFRDGTYIKVKSSDPFPGTSRAQSYEIVGGTAGVKQAAEDAPPPVSGGYQWNVTTGRYDIPIGEGDPADIAWKKNLDRMEQQERINKLRAAGAEADKPAAPSLSTAAEYVYEWDPEQKRWVPKKNINYVDPVAQAAATAAASRTPRETAAETYAKERAKWRAEIEAMIEKKQWEYDHGYVQKPAELQAIKDTAERAIKELDYNYSVALAEEQSRQRMREWEETERPYKEAAERRAGQQLELQQAQTQIGALQKQGEVGQGIIQQAVKAGVYHKVPDAGRMLRFAFDPVLEAAAIAKRLSPQQSQGVPLAPVEGVPLAPVR